MADANIKKVVVPEESLPTYGYATEKHRLRYRIVSDDRNRTSHWSPFYSIDNDGIDLSDGEVVLPPPPVEVIIEPVMAEYITVKTWQTQRTRGRERVVKRKTDVYVRWIGDPKVINGELTDGEDAYPWELIAAEYYAATLEIRVVPTYNYPEEYPLYAEVAVQLAGSKDREKPDGRFSTFTPDQRFDLWYYPEES